MEQKSKETKTVAAGTGAGYRAGAPEAIFRSLEGWNEWEEMEEFTIVRIPRLFNWARGAFLQAVSRRLVWKLGDSSVGIETLVSGRWIPARP